MNEKIKGINIWRAWCGRRYEATSELYFENIAGVTIAECGGEACVKVKVEGGNATTLWRKDRYPNGRTREMPTDECGSDYFIPVADVLGAMWVRYESGGQGKITILDLQN